MKKNRTFVPKVGITMWIAAWLIAGLGTVHAQATNLNDIEHQARRSADLMGSYLAVIASPAADPQTVAKYKSYAKALFTPDAIIEVSSLSRKPVQKLSVEAYIDLHYDMLFKSAQYDSVALDWTVRVPEISSYDGSITCIVDQTFEGVGYRSGNYYADSTVKSLSITFEEMEVPVQGAKPIKTLRISGIRVVNTFGLRKTRWYRPASSAESMQ